MRVVHVVPALFGADGVVGGAERYAGYDEDPLFERFAVFLAVLIGLGLSIRNGFRGVTLTYSQMFPAGDEWWTNAGWQVIGTCRDARSAAETDPDVGVSLAELAARHDVTIDPLDLADRASIDALARRW